MHLPVHFTFDPKITYNNITSPYCLFIKKCLCGERLSLGVNKELRIPSSVTTHAWLTTPQLQAVDQAVGD